MTPENIENLMFLTLNKRREINYEDIAIKLEKKIRFLNVGLFMKFKADELSIH